MTDLRDKAEIIEVLLRYGSSLDEEDWSRLKTCFTPDVVGVLAGGPPLDGYPAVEEAVRTALAVFDRTQHLITSPEVELDGDTARLRANLLATHVQESGNFIVGGIYREGLVRTEEGWRISHHQLDTIWMEGT